MLLFEEDNRYLNYERGLLIDRTGKVIVQQDGGAHSIRWALADAQKGEGGILTHNHPSAGSFSDADINFLTRFRLKEIRAVGHRSDYGKVDYSAKLIGERPKWDSDIKDSMAFAENQARVELEHKLGAGEISIDNINFNINHRKWELFQADNSSWFEYKRVIR